MQFVVTLLSAVIITELNIALFKALRLLVAVANNAPVAEITKKDKKEGRTIATFFFTYIIQEFSKCSIDLFFTIILTYIITLVNGKMKKIFKI